MDLRARIVPYHATDAHQEGRTIIRDVASLTLAMPRSLPRLEPREAQPAAPARIAAQPPPLDPRLRVEAGLNLLMIEFRSADGELRTSIPSPRELQAYRVAGPDTPSLDLTG